jgi:hypothetical protein
VFLRNRGASNKDLATINTTLSPNTPKGKKEDKKEDKIEESK